VKELLNDIKYLRPTYFPSVPRLMNRIYDKVHARISRYVENITCQIVLYKNNFHKVIYS